MSKIKSRQYIFCYFDILGYRELIDKYCNDDGLITYLKELLTEKVYHLIEGYKIGKHLKDPKSEISIFLKLCKFSLISDTILIRMPLQNLPKLSNDYDELTNLYRCIDMFMAYLSTFYVDFCSSVGRFLRGGIAINQHFEENINNDGLFVVSKALIDAYELEKRADVIRILMHNNVPEYIEKTFGVEGKTDFEETFSYLDENGDRCFHYYLSVEDNWSSRSFLRLITKNVAFQLEKNKDNSYICRKYKSLIDYHNSYIPKVNLKEYIIN